jgi:hypothetical protein
MTPAPPLPEPSVAPGPATFVPTGEPVPSSPAPFGGLPPRVMPPSMLATSSGAPQPLARPEPGEQVVAQPQPHVFHRRRRPLPPDKTPPHALPPGQPTTIRTRHSIRHSPILLRGPIG